MRRLTEAEPAPLQFRLEVLDPLIEGMAERAGILDRDEAFPVLDVAALRNVGAFSAPLPCDLGGAGAGTEPAGTSLLFEMLRRIGRGNLCVGRIFEAHVNAIRLVMERGTPRQRNDTARDVHTGHLFGLWVTDPPDAPLIAQGGRLQGRKGPCSGAGHATRALVTVRTPEGDRLALLPLTGIERIEPMLGTLQGMRSSANGVVHFDGVALPRAALVGEPGDYLREPSLSTGAWRTSAVTLGGLDALVDATRTQLIRRGRGDNVQQQDRFGQILIAQETARLWAWEAALRGEDPHRPTPDRVAYVNLARIAIETATLDAMRMVQRSLGLGAFLRPNPVERLLRDLAVYLRQPAPDAVLAEAAQHGLRHA